MRFERSFRMIINQFAMAMIAAAERFLDTVVKAFTSIEPTPQSAVLKIEAIGQTLRAVAAVSVAKVLSPVRSVCYGFVSMRRSLDASAAV